MEQVVTTLLSSKTFDGTSAKGPWLKTVFDAADGREYATFDGALASKAQGLIGQAVTVSFKTSQRGKYTNYDLEDVEAAPAGAAQAAPVASSSKSDQFRTKEELRYTAAMELAITSFGIAGLDPVAKTAEVYELADEYALRLSQIDDE